MTSHIPLTTRLWALLVTALVGVLMLPLSAVHAHGLAIDYHLTPVIALRVDLALTDAAGAPLHGAAIAVTAPGEADSQPDSQADPWLATELDAAAFSFVPDPALPGLWRVTIMADAGDAALNLPLDTGPDHARLAPGEAVALAAHGIDVQVTLTPITTVAIALDARFEGGEALADAQVTVYAPDDAKTPWLRGTADEAGHYVFVADVTNAGTWDIQVRKAGHGEWINVALDADTVEMTQANAPGDTAASTTLRIADDASSGGSTGYTTAQIVLMAASVIWGMVGTALYVSRRRETPAERD